MVLTLGTGVMIGEMWDLERLCEKAEELGRHTCFVSSIPLKVSDSVQTQFRGGVGEVSVNVVHRSPVVLRAHRMLLRSFDEVA
jgi:hypothetical protein